MTTPPRTEDIEIVAYIQDKSGKRTSAKTPYFEVTLLETGKDYSVLYRMFDGIDQGSLARTVEKGESIRCTTYTRPAKPSGNYHHIREILEVVDMDNPDSYVVNGEELTAEMDDTFGTTDDFDPDFDSPASNAPAQDSATTAPSGQQQDTSRSRVDIYIPMNSDNSISIERQVSVKAGVELIGFKVKVLEALLASGQLVSPDPNDPFGMDVLNQYWAWVTSGDSVRNITQSVADWLEFGR